MSVYPAAVAAAWKASTVASSLAANAMCTFSVGSPEHTYIEGATGSFSFVRGDEPTEHVHIAFGVDTDALVDAFHAAATGAGYTDNGAPGERPVYHPGYYGAFVLDPDGHNIEAVNHNR